MHTKQVQILTKNPQQNFPFQSLSNPMNFFASTADRFLQNVHLITMQIFILQLIFHLYGFFGYIFICVFKY